MNSRPTPTPKLIPFPNVSSKPTPQRLTHNLLPMEIAEKCAVAIGRKVMRQYDLTMAEALPIFFFTIDLLQDGKEVR